MKHIFILFLLVIFGLSCTTKKPKKGDQDSLLEEFSGNAFAVASDMPIEGEVKGDLKIIFDADSTGRFRMIKGSDLLNMEFNWKIKSDTLHIASLPQKAENRNNFLADTGTNFFLVIKESNGYLLKSNNSQLHLTSNEINLKNIDYKNTFEVLELIIKCLAILLGGLWIYLKYIRTRENQPKIQFDLDARFIVRQDGKIVIELFALLSNKGLVRHYISDFTFDFYISKNDSSIENGNKKINYQVLFLKANPQKDKDDIDKKNKDSILWIPKEWDKRFVDPSVENKITYLIWVPGDTSMICIYSRFETKKRGLFKKNKVEVQSAMRTFSIYELENKKGPQKAPEPSKEPEQKKEPEPQKIKTTKKQK